MRHVFETMGTTVSLEIDDENLQPTLCGAVEQVFTAYDERFSLYRPDSELSRIAAGTLRLTDASPEVKNAYWVATEWRSTTSGAFTPHRPDGVIDLNGVVKALAIRDASRVLGASASAWWLSAGGDAQWSGCDAGGLPWPIGIIDPADRRRMLCSITPPADRSAIATSGRAERGDHIWRTVAAGDDIMQATVVASDIVTADVLATAIIAGGHAVLQSALEDFDVDALTVDRNGALSASPGFRGMVGVTASA